MSEEILPYAESIAKFDPVFGIECHIELGTNTKMFCPAEQLDSNDPDFTPNSHTTPVSLGLPGSLPVVNQKAVEYAVKIGLALNCQINQYNVFARKNYFYPDLTKNYQISQSDLPIAINGFLDIEVDGEIFHIEIERAHMEEDAGKNTHVGETGRIHNADYSLIDYNRAGVPLVEIVTKPIKGAGAKTPQVAAAYVRALRDIFRALGVSEARMEKGNLRADVNLSLTPKNTEILGTRTETKNVNSFSSIEKAATFEIQRQAQVLQSGQKIVQETRHYHEATGETSSGRIKSDSDDYRYFDDPDLIPLQLTDEFIENIRAQIPELPIAKRKRLFDLWGATDEERRDIINSDSLELIEATINLGSDYKDAKKWYLGILSKYANQNSLTLQDLSITPQHLHQINLKIQEGKLNDKLARVIIDKILLDYSETSPSENIVEEIIKSENLEIVEDSGELSELVKQVLLEDQDVLNKLKSGNMAPIGVVIGKMMKATGGKADANKVRELVNEILPTL